MKLLSIMVAAMFAVTAQAQITATPTEDANTSTIQNQDPKAMDDGSWIGISGTVKSVGEEEFVLDHGNGTITVKLQHEDLETDVDHDFIKDEKVRVYGVIDDNFFLSTTILARAVFVESLSTYVYRTDGVDEFIKISTPVIASGTVVQGTVSEIEENKLVLDEGERKITVDTSLLKEDEDPLTADNASAVKVGDMVTIVGNTDTDFWTGRTFRATSMMPLSGLDNGGEMQGSDRDY